ncbi:MAG: DUF2155 domain-containing protein [Deferribacteraceae bacterium]|jgi:hypothetical protein|nr:DUF2155 domain-containing protein [Deferribacteraceae bacterium]
MRFLVIIIFAVLLAACSQNSKKSGAAPVKSSSSPAAAVAAEQIEPIPAEILERYKGARFEILEFESGKKVVVDLLFNETVRVENFPITISIIQFFPDFKMSEANNFFTASLEPNNLAARVNVATDDGHEFYGWLFAEYPAIHPFPDPKYDLVLLNAIER